jgi:glycosyl transferase family 25
MQHIDKIFVINLDKRNDRLDEFLIECKKVDINPSEIERFSAIYKPENPCVGCTLSHLEVIKIAKERSYENIIVFEDDFEFLVQKETFYKNLERFFSLNIEFKVAMLAYGCNYSHTQTRVNDIISFTTDASNAAGYIVNKSCYDELIDCLTYGAEKLEQTGEHWNYINDQIWKKLQGEKWFIFNERIGKQRPSYSELSGTYKYPEN